MLGQDLFVISFHNRKPHNRVWPSTSTIDQQGRDADWTLLSQTLNSTDVRHAQNKANRQVLKNSRQEMHSRWKIVVQCFLLRTSDLN